MTSSLGLLKRNRIEDGTLQQFYCSGRSGEEEKLRGLKGTKAEQEISDLKSAVIPGDEHGFSY